VSRLKSTHHTTTTGNYGPGGGGCPVRPVKGGLHTARSRGGRASEGGIILSIDIKSQNFKTKNGGNGKEGEFPPSFVGKPSLSEGFDGKEQGVVKNPRCSYTLFFSASRQSLVQRQNLSRDTSVSVKQQSTKKKKKQRVCAGGGGGGGGWDFFSGNEN